MKPPAEAAIKPRELEVFHAIMSSPSLTQAARILGVSQPAVSATLKQLEARLGFRLFDRTGGRLVATREADLLFPEVESAFLRLQALRRRMKGMHNGAAGFLSVIATPTLADTLVPPAYARIRERRPGVRLQLEAAVGRQVADRVLRREFDLGLIYGPSPHLEVRAESLGQTKVACAMRADHPLARKAVVTTADLHGQAIATFPRGAPFREKIEECFRGAGQELMTEAEVTYSLTACELAVEGTGVALVDPLAVARLVLPGLAIRPFEPSLSIEVTLIDSRDRPRSPLSNEMIDELRNALAHSLARMPVTAPSAAIPASPGRAPRDSRDSADEHPPA